jgi:hypothetical protein
VVAMREVAMKEFAIRELPFGKFANPPANPALATSKTQARRIDVLTT